MKILAVEHEIYLINMENENNKQKELSAMLKVYLGSYDFCYQFEAIKKFLEHSKKYIQEQAKETEDVEAANINEEYGDYVIAEKYHESVYWDAAYSMAAVGQIAPLLESLMTDYFKGLGKRHSDAMFESNRFKNIREIAWDPHYVFDKGEIREDLCDGLDQLIKDLELKSKLPEYTSKIFRALMVYRNKMFHNGLEWPEKQRKKFAEFIQQQKIEKWFTYSICGNDTWIYYMEEVFIDECLKLAKFLIGNLGGIGPKNLKYRDTI
jgi:hypothetical protein